MYYRYKEQNCIIYFLVMQQLDKVLLTAMALYDWYEAMEVSRHQLVFSVLRKYLIQFYSMYLELASQHPS